MACDDGHSDVVGKRFIALCRLVTKNDEQVLRSGVIRASDHGVLTHRDAKACRYFHYSKRI